MDIRKPIPTNGGDVMVQWGLLWKKQIALLQKKFSSAIQQVRMPQEDLTDVPIVFITVDSLVELMRFLKEEETCAYQFLADITATDEQKDPRFRVVYQLFSPLHKNRIRVKVSVSETESISTITSLWPGANWAEREVYDMFGIQFKDHPDLRRILMDQRWEGYPLRKDYPLKGYQVFTEPEPIQMNLLESL